MRPVLLASATATSIRGFALQIELQLGIPTGDGGQELTPDRTVALRRGAGDLGHVGGPIVRPANGCVQIHHACGRVQRPGIAIPDLGRLGMAPIGSRDALDSRNRRGR